MRQQNRAGETAPCSAHRAWVRRGFVARHDGAGAACRGGL